MVLTPGAGGVQPSGRRGQVEVDNQKRRPAFADGLLFRRVEKIDRSTASTPATGGTEKMDDDGTSEIAVFRGLGSREQAIRYAHREYGEFDEIVIARERLYGSGSIKIGTLKPKVLRLSEICRICFLLWRRGLA
jgi:hypothetical protein